MGTLDHPTPQPDAEALRWAHSRFDCTRSELLTHATWAKTYRLTAPDAEAYLKIVPSQQAARLNPLAALAAHFHAQLPKLLAHDASQGWTLAAAHGAVAMTYGSADADIENLVCTYARMQVEAAGLPALFAGLPQPEIASLPAQLLHFLASPVTVATAADTVVGAAYFIGPADAARYERLLQHHLPVLQQHISGASELPLTLNHGDLRPPNAAIAADGRCIILDWDDAMVGPAGLSLHALFSGCSVPTVLLSGSAAAEAAAHTPNAQRLNAYINTLADGGYADAATLRRVLPATACAGQMQFLLNFARFPGEQGRGGVRDTLLSRLSDLLDLCDHLVSR